tara:strand:- start:499 stop:996 length:498 start_codon:yes stop_codon:yes gene_type:complete
MPEAEINFEDIAKGNVRIDIVDKLENLRESLESNSLTGRVNKKEIINKIDEIIDTIPVELRTARWIVREQESFINKAKDDSKEIVEEARRESEKLIQESYVLQEAVIEANAIIKQTELEAQSYRANIEDSVDRKMEEIQSKINQLKDFLDQERTKLRQPRDIEKP